jgi:transcriptional regulator with XRE-family HTH domain
MGRRLKKLRERERLTLEEAGKVLRWSTSKLNRIELGQLPDIHGLKSRLDLYCVTGDQWEEYFRLFDEAQEPGWWRAYGLDNMGYVPLEAEASMVREFTLAAVPGLLQTVDYARALFVGAEDRPADQLRTAVIVRTLRSKQLHSPDDPLELVAVMAEMALHHPVVGPEVMAEQLDHLVEAAGLHTVTLRVLPVSVGAHVGMAGGFTLLSFGELGEPDVLYTENLNGSSFSEKERAISRATLAHKRLLSQALEPGRLGGADPAADPARGLTTRVGKLRRWHPRRRVHTLTPKQTPAPFLQAQRALLSVSASISGVHLLLGRSIARLPPLRDRCAWWQQ